MSLASESVSSLLVCLECLSERSYTKLDCFVSLRACACVCVRVHAYVCALESGTEKNRKAHY